MRSGTVKLAGGWPAFGGLALVLGLAGAAVLAGSSNGGQPIRFNHKAHVSKGLDCAVCHRYVREQAFASLPTLQTCMMCHAAKMSQNPEEGKVREFAAKNEPLKWVRLYRLTPDAAAYFSHRRHVTLGKIECATCHGPMAEQTAPPPRALVNFSMDFCLDCHQQKEVATACVACHRLLERGSGAGGRGPGGSWPPTADRRRPTATWTSEETMGESDRPIRGEGI